MGLPRFPPIHVLLYTINLDFSFQRRCLGYHVQKICDLFGQKLTDVAVTVIHRDILSSGFGKIIHIMKTYLKYKTMEKFKKTIHVNPPQSDDSAPL